MPSFKILLDLPKYLSPYKRWPELEQLELAIYHIMRTINQKDKLNRPQFKGSLEC